MEPLINFLIYMPKIYALLSNDTKMLVELAIDKQMDFRIASTYNKDSLQDHFNYLETLFTE